MIRIWSQLALNAQGEPTASFIYYDPVICDLDAEVSNNYYVQTARDGTERIIYDPKYLYPVRGDLILDYNHINLTSNNIPPYYLGPELYRNNALHLPICIFQKELTGGGRKCYVAYLNSVPKELASLATTARDRPMNTNRIAQPRNLVFNLLITLDGVYNDFDDIAFATTWNPR